MNDRVFRFWLGILGYLFAIFYIAGWIIFFQHRISSVEQQNFIIGFVLFTGFLCGLFGHEMRERRRTYHNYYKKECQYHEKIDPFEQKMDQVCIIHTITAGIMVLIQVAVAQGWYYLPWFSGIVLPVY